MEDQSYLNSGQQQHRPVSASVGQRTLPTPTVQGELRQWSHGVNITWIARQEGINASTYYDNVTQLDYAEAQFGGSPDDMQNFEN